MSISMNKTMHNTKTTKIIIRLTIQGYELPWINP